MVGWRCCDLGPNWFQFNSINVNMQQMAIWWHCDCQEILVILQLLKKKKKSKCMYWFWYIWLTYNLCGSYRPLHIQSGRSALKNVYGMIVYLHVCIMFLTYACGDCKSLNPSWEACVQLLLLSTVFSMYKAAECTLYIHFGWVSPSMVSLHLGTFLEPYGDFLNGTFKHSVIV